MTTSVGRVLAIALLSLAVLIQALSFGAVLGFDRRVEKVIQDLPGEVFRVSALGGITTEEERSIKSELEGLALVAAETATFFYAPQRLGEDGRLQFIGHPQQVQGVSANYFAVRNIPLLSGRVFTDDGAPESLSSDTRWPPGPTAYPTP